MAKPALVKQALEVASPAQLIRVRAILVKYRKEVEEGGFEGNQLVVNRAIEAFDAREFDSPEVANLLPDEALGEALR
ncbi:MAG: hypothetical protein AAB505_00125 [Patescibacteria group bacterium]